MNWHLAYVEAVTSKRVAEDQARQLRLDSKMADEPTTDDYLMKQSDLRQIIRQANKIIARYEKMTPLARRVSTIRARDEVWDGS